MRRVDERAGADDVQAVADLLRVPELHAESLLRLRRRYVEQLPLLRAKVRWAPTYFRRESAQYDLDAARVAIAELERWVREERRRAEVESCAGVG